jgi:uncharacterized repeat protein (TIGR01451 family)
MNHLLRFILFSLLLNTSFAQGNHERVYLYLESFIEEDSVEVHVKANNFYDVAACQFSLVLDTAHFAFGHGSYEDDLKYNFKSAFSDNFIVHQNKNAIFFVWNTDFSYTNNLPDGYTIFKYKLGIIKVDSIICFKFSNQLVFEVIDNQDQTVPSRGIQYCEQFDLSNLKGKIYFDVNQDCTLDSNSIAYPYKTVRIKNSAGKYFYAITNLTGEYLKSLPPDSYTVDIPLNLNLQSCTVAPEIDLREARKTEVVDHLVSQISTCPNLETEFTIGRFRLCSESYVNLMYQNFGNQKAVNVYIDFQIEDSLEIKASSHPFQLLSPFLYRFLIGDLPAFSRNQIHINLQTTCDINYLNRTICMQANIYPDTICSENPNWSKADLKINAECKLPNVVFKITNIGDGDMNQAVPYTIVEDDLMPGFKGNIQLKSNESIDIIEPANGKTYRIIVDSIRFHPYQTRYTDAIEACGTNLLGDYSKAFVNLFSEYDSPPTYSKKCATITASYDPNEKQASPIGVTEEHRIDVGNRIYYTIHFQNTGTDTAFRVIVEDKLSDYLDYASLQILGSSHEFELDSRLDRKLRFVFNNINLPDSTTDYFGSNGFVSFSILPISNFLKDFKIYNTSNIVFDFNPAIITNTTFHSLADLNFTLIEDYKVKNKLNLKLFPNPFMNIVNVTWDGNFICSYFDIYDLLGNKVFEQETKTLEKNISFKLEIPKGIYFIRMYDDKGVSPFIVKLIKN